MALQPKNYLVPINLNKNEIRQAVLENSSTGDPSSPVKGQVYYDSTNNLTKIYNGTTFQTIATTALTLSAFGATTSSQLAGVISDETGSGNLVFSTSPVLTTPNIGTPSYAVLSSATGLPISTGVSGLGTNVATFLGTPNSSNLLNAVTDETGTGSLVFSTSPVLTTPNIGVPSYGNLASTFGYPTANLTGLGTNVATFLATPNSLNLLNAVTNETGTGSLVFSTSPTLTTPVIGVATGTSLNVTGQLISTQATGTAPFVVSSTTEVTNLRSASATVAYGVAVANVTGLGTNVATFLATPSSTNFANALTDETGTSGSVVFSASPTFTGTVTAANANYSGTVNFSGIITVPDPTQDSHAANKKYVDSAVAGLTWKEAVNLLVDTNIALTGSTNTLSIDGHANLTSASTGYRLLLTAQTTATEKGIYDYTDNGTSYTLTRSADADAYTELIGATVFITEGTTYGKTSWTQSNTYLTNFSGQSWVQFSGASSTTAGLGLIVNGNAFDINTASSSRINVQADTIDLASVTQTNGTPAATNSFVTSFTVDTWGRVTGTNTTTVVDATSSVKGLASFNSTNFTVSSGAVTINTVANTAITGTIGIAQGGTGATTASAARTALSATGKYTATNALLQPVSNSVTWSISAATHGLGATPGLIVQVRDTATTSVVDVDIQVNESTGDVTLNWNATANVAIGAYRVTIIG